jgi:wyosine [tRNA(Phe)-imidazoG37] synthetase (radical SAM superfamily)
MMRETLVFGPIFSRRLGASLGINVLPEKGKLCNFDCIYCECGWNADGRGDRRLPSAKELEKALEEKLSQCLKDGSKIDSITFSGDGEPTLNPDFPAMVDITISLRDKYFPSAAVTVLSNASTLWKPGIAAALMKVDNPILKIDAPSERLASIVNRPSPGYDLGKVVSAMESLGGNFILQTMFLKAPGFDSSSEEVLSLWKDLVRRVRPRKVMVYTIARETPMKGLEKFTRGEMARLVGDLVEEGFDLQINE